eukprot:355656-Chlamydomonas_euryale.AAC.11
MRSRRHRTRRLSDSVADRTVDHIMHTMDELTSVKAEQRWQCARKKVMGVVAVQVRGVGSAVARAACGERVFRGRRGQCA